MKMSTILKVIVVVIIITFQYVVVQENIFTLEELLQHIYPTNVYPAFLILIKQ